MQNTFLAACELKNKVLTAVFAAFLLTVAPAAAMAGSAYAPADSAELRRDPAEAAYGREGGQEHPPAAASQAAGEHAPAGEHHDESIGGMILGMGWPVANFIIFIGVLYYFLNQPIREYLTTRDSTIRKDLVEAVNVACEQAGLSRFDG